MEMTAEDRSNIKKGLKLLCKGLAAIYLCLLIYLLITVLISTKYGGAAALPGPFTYRKWVGHSLSIFLYVALLGFPGYFVIPGLYHAISIYLKQRSVGLRIITAGLVGSLGAFLYLVSGLMKSNTWLLDCSVLGCVGLLYGWLDASWIRKQG